jgi:hypothetical protein
MAKPWMPYVVQQGDHVEKLAFLRGVTAEEVWSHPKNAELKAKRKSMHQLLPGDVLSLPDAPMDWLSLDQGTTNSYVARVPLKDFELIVRGKDGPLSGAPYVIAGLPHREGEPAPRGTTDGSGSVKFEAPVTTREVTVILPRHHIEYVMRIGDMDPHDEPSGAMQRLKNLGFLARDAHAGEDISRAIALFQLQVGLPVTGALDGATQPALDEMACP